MTEDRGRAAFMVADGLGHGPSAARPSRAAIEAFQDHPFRQPHDLLVDVHAALRSTRGAAVAIAAVNTADREIQYAGVGNIVGAIVADETRNMVSHNGTLGFQARKFQQFAYSWPQSGLLVMHSDGLATQWRLDRYPGLKMRHPSLIAGVLYRDYRRGRDDVTVVVARETEARPAA